MVYPCHTACIAALHSAGAVAAAASHAAPLAAAGLASAGHTYTYNTGKINKALNVSSDVACGFLPFQGATGNRTQL